MKLTIIIPVYNVEPYLADCLNSVLSQDMEDYEVICVEDCSTDNSFSILQDFAGKHEQIRIIRHSRNRGLSAARNTGIQNARGEYLQFVDSDDMLELGTSRQLYQAAKEYDADVVYFNMTFLNDEEHSLIRREQENREFPGVYSGRRLFCLHQEASTRKPEAVRHFVKKEFILSNNLLFYEGIIHEDLLFSFLAAMKAERVIDVNKSLYIYRQRPGSISWGQKEKTAGSLLVCLFHICSYWMLHDFSPEENRWVSDYVRGMYKTFLHYRGYQESGKLLGQEKEQMLQRILTENYFEDISFGEQDIQRLRESEENILYGAGKIAAEVFELLKAQGIRFGHVAVTDEVGNAGSLYGIPIKRIDDLAGYTGAQVVVGTGRESHGEIVKTLEGKGFYNIILPRIKL